MSTIIITKKEMESPLAYVSDELFDRLVIAYDKVTFGRGKSFLESMCERPLKIFFCSAVNIDNLNLKLV